MVGVAVLISQLAVGFVTGNLGHAHPVLLSGADAHRDLIFDIDDRIGGDARLHQPAEQQVLILIGCGAAVNFVDGALVLALGQLEVIRAGGFWAQRTIG